MRSSTHSKSARRALAEPLEGRTLLSVTLGTNIVTNGDAESNVGSATGSDVILPTGWTANGSPTVVKYGVTEFPSATDPGPSSRGKNFFAGGPGDESDLFQTIDVSSLASSIDAGKIKYSLSGFLGGFSAQDDEATLFANFQGTNHTFVNQTFIGPVNAAARGSVTGLLSRSSAATLPAGTRFIQVQIHFDPLSGGYNDGYADNISMVLTSTAVTTGGVTGIAYNDVNADGVRQSTELGLANVTVFIDKNSNGKLDAGETSAKTTPNGAYNFANLAAGSYRIMEIVPSLFRATTTNPLVVAVTAGTTKTANFGDTQLALITGNVFNDANGNKVKDTNEKGIAGITVYLDFNNNGQLDSFELKTVTDASGNYKFTLPFGSYVVREVVPAGKVQTTPTGGYAPVLTKGLIASGKNFGIK